MDNLLYLALFAGAVFIALRVINTRPHPSRTQELLELEALYDRIVPAPFLDSIEEFIADIMDALDSELSDPMRQALHAIVGQEKDFPRPDFAHLDLAQQVELKRRLKKWELRAEDGEELAREYLFVLFGNLARKLPRTQNPSPFVIPLVYAIPDAKEYMQATFADLFDARYRERDLFQTLSQQLYLNICHASGIDPDNRGKRPFKFPGDADLPLEALVRTYFRNTPLLDLFLLPVPLKFTYEDRFNHMHVIGGTGAGKTTLIENLILDDLSAEERPALVVIDPHSDLIRKLTRANLGIDPIIIDPRDTKHPVALNPFAINRERLLGYDDTTREQVTAGVIQTFDYLFSNLFSLSLTGKQQTFFRYVTRLLLTLPQVEGRNATILDMLRLIQDPAPYQNAINQLPEISREFFTRDFVGKTYADTKDQVRYRIQAIIENPTLARLFTAPETKVDFFTELNRGAVILIDTAEDFLKDGSAVFGKLMVALLLQAIQERAAIHPTQRKPAFLLIDEAADLFSSNIDDLLTDARKYRCGLVLAHQYLDQAAPSLKASLAANTGIKFASGLSAADARAMAPEMRTTPDFILSQPKLQFAAHIRHVTPQAVSIPIQPVTGHERLSEAAYEALMARNRARVSLLPQAPPQPPQRPTEDDGEWI